MHERREETITIDSFMPLIIEHHVPIPGCWVFEVEGDMEQIVLQTAGVFSGGCLRTLDFSKIYALFTF